MTKRAELEFSTKGVDRGVSDLDALDRKLKDVDKTSQALSTRMRDLRKLWEDPAGAKGGWSTGQRLSAAIIKPIAELVTDNARQIADAVTAPGKTTYAGAIEQAYRYRLETQRIATASRESFGEVDRGTTETSRRLGLLPGQVQQYGRSVRSMTGDWHGAMDGLEAFNTRALRTDRTLEEMVPLAVELTNQFGTKSTDQVSRFFGTMDAQAKRAGVSIERAERNVMNFSGTLAGVKGTDAERTGLAQVFHRGVREDVGNRTTGAFMGMIQQYRYGIESEMRAKGKLKKGEHLFDNQTGQWDFKQLSQAGDFIPGFISKFYGAKNRGDAIEKLGRIQFGGDYEVAANLLNLKPGDIAKMGAVSGRQMNSGFLTTDAGKRQMSEADKNTADRLFGDNFLGAQDYAVEKGGGSRGIAMAQMGQVFDKSVGAFSMAVDIFANAAGKGRGGVVSDTVDTVKKGAVGGLAMAYAVPTLVAGGLGAVAGGLRRLVNNYDSSERAQEELAFKPMREGQAPELQAKTMETRSWMRGNHLGWLLPDDDSDIGGPKGGLSTADAAAQAEQAGAAVAKHLAGQTLRVQMVTTPPAPPSAVPTP